VPCIARWPGKIKPGTVENGIFSGLDWLPTLVAAAGNPSIVQQLLQGVPLGGQTYKNHLDGYNQMDLLTGKGPSARHEVFYFGESQLGAIRIDDFKFQFYQQPFGWPGEKVTTDMPTIVNLRQDPFERTPSLRGQTLNDLGGGYMNDFYAREFWRFVQVQQTVAVAARSLIDYPPMQQAASFNLTAIKEKIEAMMKSHEGQYRRCTCASGSVTTAALTSSTRRMHFLREDRGAPNIDEMHFTSPAVSLRSAGSCARCPRPRYRAGLPRHRQTGCDRGGKGRAGPRLGAVHQERAGHARTAGPRMVDLRGGGQGQLYRGRKAGSAAELH
jgi:hypothetical protein